MKDDLFIMLVGVAIIGMLIVFARPAHADFNFGHDTYETVDSSLIVNSLGDQVAISQAGDLGDNDYIPQNAVKNSLLEQGYTAAWDDVAPEGVDVTAIEYYGKDGDPRAIGTTYVLTEEYNALNASAQDERINTNAAGIADNSSRITDLEGTQYKAQLTLRLYDAKYFSVSTYGQYNIGRQKADEFGINITLKLTKSYEEKQLEKMEARMARLERNAAHKAIMGE